MALNFRVWTSVLSPEAVICYACSQFTLVYKLMNNVYTCHIVCSQIKGFWPMISEILYDIYDIYETRYHIAGGARGSKLLGHSTPTAPPPEILNLCAKLTHAKCAQARSRDPKELLIYKLST